MAAFDENDSQNTYLPIGIERLQMYGEIGSVVQCYGKLREVNSEKFFELTFADQDGNVLATIASVRFRQANRRSLRQMVANQASNLLYAVRWQQTVTPRPTSAGGLTWLVLGEPAARQSLSIRLAQLRHHVRTEEHADALALLSEMTSAG